MRKTKKAIASLAIAGMVLSMAPMSVFGATTDSNRLAGAGRVETAIAVANQGWANGADSVIVVPADDANIVDALAAAPLAGQLNAPILVTYKGALDPQVAKKITELGAKNVYAVGALEDATIASLKAISGVTVEQIQGADRTETAAKVAAKLTKVNGSFVVAYEGSADALSAASYAAANGYSIVISNPDGTIPASETVTAPVYTVGGQAKYTGATPLAGADRYATNDAVNNGLTFQYDKVYVANGESLVDALAGAPLAAQTKSPIVLADATKAATGVNDNLTSTSKVIALGGTGAVSDSVLGQVAYQAPATLAVESVSAINASQLQVKFSKAVNKNSVVSGTALVPGIQITRLPDNADDNTIVVGNLIATLSTDNMTLTLTADPTIATPKFFDGTYSIYIPSNAITAKDNGELLPSYTTTVAYDDQTAPTVSSVVFNSATNQIDVKMSEPVATAPTVTINGGAPLAKDALNASKTTYSYNNTWTLGTNLDVKVFGAIDANGNQMASTYTTNVALTQNTVAPTVSAISQSDSNVIKITFSKAPNGASDADKVTTVTNALKVYRAGTAINLATVVAPATAVTLDTTDSSKCTYKVALDTTGAPDYAFYDGKTSVTLTVDIADGAFVDVFGIANDGEIAKTVVMTKDTAAPVINNVVLNSDKDAFLVYFNKNVDDSTVAAAVAPSTLPAGISVRQDGIDVSDSFTFATGSVGDDQVIQLAHSGDIPSGVYTIRFDDNAINDTVGNGIDAVSKSVTVSSTDSVVTVASITPGVTNQYVVAFNGGSVGTSALNATNYTLDGAALPSGSDIYFSASDKTEVTITLPSSSVNYNSTTSVLRVANVLDSNGSKVSSFSGTVAVVDNVKPTLKSASVVGNIITLNFDETMANASGIADFADLVAELSIKGGTVELTGTTGALSTSTDGSKVVIVIGNVGDSNWNTVKAYSSLTIKTKDTSALATKNLTDDTSLNIVQKDVSVSAPVTR